MMWRGHDLKLFQETRRHTEYLTMRCTGATKGRRVPLLLSSIRRVTSYLDLGIQKKAGNKYDFAHCNE